MIARLVGTLVGHEGNRAILDVRDVGYEVFGPQHDVESWARSGDTITVHVSTDVREDAIHLYGFSTDKDRVVFERLRSVNGVGPKVALATLDTLRLDALVAAVETDDTKALARIPGVGKKLASRMALELKGKLPATFVPTDGTPDAEPEPPPVDDTFALALARLGYTKSEIKRAAQRVASEGLSHDAPVADRVTAALRVLSGGA